jgi:hypothetical protein
LWLGIAGFRPSKQKKNTKKTQKLAGIFFFFPASAAGGGGAAAEGKKFPRVSAHPPPKSLATLPLFVLAPIC